MGLIYEIATSHEHYEILRRVHQARCEAWVRNHPPNTRPCANPDWYLTWPNYEKPHFIVSTKMPGG